MHEPDFEPKTAWRLYLLPALAFILALLLIALAAMQAPAMAEARAMAVIRPALPTNVQIVKAPCPGMEGEVAGCMYRAGEADVTGRGYTIDTVYTDGYLFTTRHELGHVYEDRYLDPVSYTHL